MKELSKPILANSICSLLFFFLLFASCAKTGRTAKEEITSSGLTVQDTVSATPVEVEQYVEDIVLSYDTTFFKSSNIEERDSIASIVRRYRLASNRSYELTAMEEELRSLLDRRNSSDMCYQKTFAYQLKKHLSDPLTACYPFEKLQGRVLITGSCEDGVRFFSYDEYGGSMRFYKTFFQYRQPDGSMGVKMVENDQLLYKAYSFVYENERYYILMSYAKYSAKSWAEYIRIASIKEGELTYHTQFFPQEYLEEKEPDINGCYLNGFVEGNSFVLSNGNSVGVKTINLVYDEETHSFSFDEIGAGHPFAEPTGERVTVKLRLKKDLVCPQNPKNI